MDYMDFLKAKIRFSDPDGIQGAEFGGIAYEFQNEVVRRAINRGRYAIFADCGLGKTLMQLMWAQAASAHGRVLILAPLCVADQTVDEGRKFGITVAHSRDGKLAGKISITNYERLDHFRPEDFAAIVLDESSILKSFSGATCQALIDFGAKIRWRLACTATPAPNDFMELGTHAEFLGVMRRPEMLSTYFIHDSADTQKWRLKGHAANPFWRWMSSWSVCIRSPKDMGINDDRFILPPINYIENIVMSHAAPGRLFVVDAVGLSGRRDARRESLDRRVNEAISIANGTDEQVIIWCDLNSESEALARGIRGAVEVKGSDSAEHKEMTAKKFAAGEIRVIVSKPSIYGFGMNFQLCHNMVFVGLSDSYEQIYQAVRRCWRYGQKQTVNVHMVYSEAEGCVIENIRRKEAQAGEMFAQMSRHVNDAYRKEMADYCARMEMKIPGFMEGNQCVA